MWAKQDQSLQSLHVCNAKGKAKKIPIVLRKLLLLPGNVAQKWFRYLPSLKLTAKAPARLRSPSQKESNVFQRSSFRCHVSFREGIFWIVHATVPSWTRSALVFRFDCMSCESKKYRIAGKHLFGAFSNDIFPYMHLVHASVSTFTDPSTTVED